MADLKNRIPSITLELPKRAEEIGRDACESIARRAAATAPKRSGDLARHYRAGDEGVYALWRYHFTEFGTSHSAAEPHLIPALEAEMPLLHARARESFGDL
jgi:hypothetical protein